MEGYNSKQKLYIFIAIAIFITINLLALVFALPFLNRGSVKGIYTDSLNSSVLVSGNLDKPIQLSSDKEISNHEDSLYIKNLNYTLFALPQANLNIKNLNLINIQKGIYYLETQSNLTLNKGFDTHISPDSKILFDSEEGNIYILKGQIEILGKQFNAGFVINLNAETLNSNLLDKGLLLSTNKVKEINKLLAGKSLFVPELNFVSKPLLEMENNLVEIFTSTSPYVLKGKISSLSSVYINSEKVAIDEDGNFTKSVDLINGGNDFQINVVDEVANTLNTNIKVIFN